MPARMTSPVRILPDAMKAAQALGAAARNGGVPLRTLYLMYLRASQINGCSFCVEMHSRELQNAGETDERIFAVAAWRDAGYFSDAERAALALTEEATRLSDRAEAVSDETWAEAQRHYDEKSLATLVVNIALINFWNRITVPTRQMAGPLAAERRTVGS
jgi:AhpD family alkylhydroperoxidase